jgi:hypothetical protein
MCHSRISWAALKNDTALIVSSISSMMILLIAGLWPDQRGG